MGSEIRKAKVNLDVTVEDAAEGLREVLDQVEAVVEEMGGNRFRFSGEISATRTE